MSHRQHENLDSSRVGSGGYSSAGSRLANTTGMAHNDPLSASHHQHAFLLNEFQLNSNKNNKLDSKRPPPPFTNRSGHSPITGVTIESSNHAHIHDTDSGSSSLSAELNKPPTTSGAAIATASLQPPNLWLLSSSTTTPSPKLAINNDQVIDNSSRSFNSSNHRLLAAPEGTTPSSSAMLRDSRKTSSSIHERTTSSSSLTFPQLVKNLQNLATPKFGSKKPATSSLPVNNHVKSNRQARVYNFLERPTGWKCFIYHFTV